MSYVKEALINLLKLRFYILITTVIHIYKTRDQRKKKFSTENITRTEMGKQNKQYMYKLS